MYFSDGTYTRRRTCLESSAYWFWFLILIWPMGRLVLRSIPHVGQRIVLENGTVLTILFTLMVAEVLGSCDFKLFIGSKTWSINIKSQWSLQSIGHKKLKEQILLSAHGRWKETTGWKLLEYIYLLYRHGGRSVKERKSYTPGTLSIIGLWRLISKQKRNFKWKHKHQA